MGTFTRPVLQYRVFKNALSYIFTVKTCICKASLFKNETRSNVKKLWFMLIYLGGQTLHYGNRCINPVRQLDNGEIWHSFSSLFTNDLRGQLVDQYSPSIYRPQGNRHLIT